MTEQNNDPRSAQRNKFRDRCLIVLSILCGILFLAIYFEVGNDFSKFCAEAAKYALVIAGLFAVQNYLIQHHKNQQVILTLLYTLQIAIAMIGIHTYFPAIRHQLYGKDEKELIVKIIQEVGDSTDNFRSTLKTEEMYNDCQGVGSRIRDYRGQLLTTIFKRENIPGKDTVRYLSRVDSALIDPASDLCNRAGQFGRMLVEFSLMIRLKKVDEIDNFFRTYHIDPSAEAIELRAGQKLYRGLLKNLIVDIMQDLTPNFKEIKPPAYSKNDEPIQQLIFTTT